MVNPLYSRMYQYALVIRTNANVSTELGEAEFASELFVAGQKIYLGAVSEVYWSLRTPKVAS